MEQDDRSQPVIWL